MRSSSLVALIALVPTLAAAQAQRSRPTITLDEARIILGTNPVALPDVPILDIYRHGRDQILLRQRPESGPVLVLIERRGEWRMLASGSSPRSEQPTRGPENVDPRAPVAAFPVWSTNPDNATRLSDDQLRDRGQSRVFPGVTVYYLGSGVLRVPPGLLDRLEPIPPGSIPGATKSVPPPR